MDFFWYDKRITLKDILWVIYCIFAFILFGVFVTSPIWNYSFARYVSCEADGYHETLKDKDGNEIVLKKESCRVGCYSGLLWDQKKVECFAATREQDALCICKDNGWITFDVVNVITSNYEHR